MRETPKERNHEKKIREAKRMLVSSGNIVNRIEDGNTQYIAVIGGKDKIRLYQRNSEVGICHHQIWEPYSRVSDVSEFVLRDPEKKLVAVRTKKCSRIFTWACFDENDYPWDNQAIYQSATKNWQPKPVQQVEPVQLVVEDIDDQLMFNPNEVVYSGAPQQSQPQPQQAQHVQPPKEEWFGSPIQPVSRRGVVQEQPVIPANAVGIIRNNSNSDLVIPTTVNGNQIALRLPNNPILTLPRKRILPGSRVSFQLYSNGGLAQITGRIGMNGAVVYVSNSTIPNDTYVLPANQQVYVYSG
jgi:hypothetical protein